MKTENIWNKNTKKKQISGKKHQQNPPFVNGSAGAHHDTRVHIFTVLSLKDGVDIRTLDEFGATKSEPACTTHYIPVPGTTPGYAGHTGIRGYRSMGRINNKTAMKPQAFRFCAQQHRHPPTRPGFTLTKTATLRKIKITLHPPPSVPGETLLAAPGTRCALIQNLLSSILFRLLLCRILLPAQDFALPRTRCTVRLLNRNLRVGHRTLIHCTVLYCTLIYTAQYSTAH